MQGHVENEIESDSDGAMRRKLLQTLATGGAMALLPATTRALSIAGESRQVDSGSEGNGMGLWSAYVDLLKPAGALTSLLEAPESQQLQAELYRQLVMNMALGYFVYFQSDPRFPDWIPFLNSAFLLQPNPDDVYHIARVDGSGTYRIVGRRGNIHILSFSIGGGIMGTAEWEPGPSLQYDADEDLQLGPDGAFEVILSAQRPAGHTGNWWRIPEEAGSILVRQRSYNWGGEEDARFAIERLDVVDLKPRMSSEDIDHKIQELFGGFTERLSRFWLNYQKRVNDAGLINKIELTDFSGAVPAQVYWQGIYEFEADEALILETDIPDQHRYWNVQINDPLFNAVEFLQRQSSLNGHQAIIDSDGKFRAVISVADPGVHNWLDTGGFLGGMVIGRWYSADSTPLPTLKRVKLDDVAKHLPDGTHLISKQARLSQISQRRIGGQLRRRW